MSEELPEGWRWARFDEVATVASNLVDPLKTPNATHIAPNHIESWTGKLLDRGTVAGDSVKSAKHAFHSGQVLYSKIRPYLAKATLVDFDGVCSADMYPLDVLPDVMEAGFLLSWILTPEFTASASDHQGRTVLPKINQDALNGIDVPVPPLDEQRRIVAKLDALRARSRRAKEALDEVPALLDRLRQSILASAFRGDLTADWRAANPDVEPASVAVARMSVAASKTGRAASIKRADGDVALAVGMPDSPAPDRWSWVPLTDVAKLESGHTPSRAHPEWWGGEVAWISIPDAREHHGKRIDTTASTVNDQGLANSSARVLPAGTVCLTRTASVGYVTMMERPMATSQDFANWVCSEAILPEWLMYLLVTERDALLRFAQGSTHATIYFPELKGFHVMLPPIAEQVEILRRVKARLQRVDELRAQFATMPTTLKGLDSAILAAAFRGELT